MQNLSKYQKIFISTRYRLAGLAKNDSDFLLALKALEYAKDFHTGTRKDGFTPEFQHQLEISQYLYTISDSLISPGKTIAAAFLHDTPEDYDISYSEIEEKFGVVICKSVELLTKKHRGSVKDMQVYFTEIGKDPIASIVKGADRINNHQSMIGVFKEQKIESYIKETQDFILPMLKEARRNFVEQEGAYENIKFSLNSQIKFINYYLSDRNVGNMNSDAVDASKTGKLVR